MAKSNVKQIKLIIPAGIANQGPPVGPALGQVGVNSKQFVDEFNTRTSGMEKGVPVPVVISVTEDRKFTFVVKSPPASVLIKKAANIKSGSANPKQIVAKLTRAQVEDIAKQKANDITAGNIEAAVRTITGTARSMGVEVEHAVEGES
ncbi:MAG: 50S ribosomal protein L11 [Gammaproteobacteria bacterium]|nr:50S ribosomal protein L11 [Gammaproteobacteria bacterium]